jgi:hypothetical protein
MTAIFAEIMVGTVGILAYGSLIGDPGDKSRQSSPRALRLDTVPPWSSRAKSNEKVGRRWSERTRLPGKS